MMHIYVKRSRGRRKYYHKSFALIEDAAKFIMRPGVFGKVLKITCTCKEKSILYSKINSLYRKHIAIQ